MTGISRLLLFTVLALPAAAPVAGQQEALVAELAPLLAAEDAREWAPAVFTAGVHSATPQVRRTAAMTLGRVGDLRALALLTPMLVDLDSTVQTTALFALGLLRDSSVVPRIIERFGDRPALTPEAAQEGITALARIGGGSAAQFLQAVLSGTLVLPIQDREPLVLRALLEAWRLGEDAPVPELVRYAGDRRGEYRWRAVYSLGRTRGEGAGEAVAAALRDEDHAARSFAARSLSRGFAVATGLDTLTAADLLVSAAFDAVPGVRIHALRSLAGYRRPDLAGRITGLLGDPVANVRVQVAATLGRLGGAAAAAALTATVADGRAGYAERREALLGLARVDTAAFLQAQLDWSSSRDWRERAVASEAWALVAPGPDVRHPDFLRDRDPRVIGAALQAWRDAVNGPEPALLAAGRGLLSHPDAVVRSLAADIVARAADPADVSALADAFRRADRDSFPDAALSALKALRAIDTASAAGAGQVRRGFLGATRPPADYLLRRWAETDWPEAAQLWGPAYPIPTGRSLDDYRAVARRFLVEPQNPASYPHVFVETEDRGTLELELFGPDAPLTVSHFLTLVERRYFDGQSWHRVVPNFVVQAGDPRGDGWGGPGEVIRDEINRRRYDQYVVGMALSGPDTGGSQWFITLSPQPHLDGGYTVFGRVVGNASAITRIVQGDHIRTIRR